MSQPLVIGYHLVGTGYGWWLPNDPRGSGSTVIRSDVLAELGELHFGRKTIQPANLVIREFLHDSKDLLEFLRLGFDLSARSLIGEAFGEVIQRENLTCYGCAIMPDHFHILLRKHKLAAEDMMMALQIASANKLHDNEWCQPDHPIWAGGSGWKVFLDHPDEMRRTIRYIENNPLALRLPNQTWPFVKIYDGWPLHPGHSQHSPYVRALKAAGRYP